MPTVVVKKPEDVEAGDEITVENNFILYSNIRLRKEKCLFLAQYQSEEIKVLGAYVRGLSFHAFSFHAFGEGKQSAAELLQAFKKELGYAPDAVVKGIVTVSASCLPQMDIPFVQSKKRLHLMKLQHTDALQPKGDFRLLCATDLKSVNCLAGEAGLMAFRDEELNVAPHIGMFDEADQLAAMAGFHIYDEEYVELGNIATSLAHRKKGLGMQMTADICRIALKKSPNVFLFVFDDNPTAKRMYEKLGFETVEAYAFMEILL